MLTPFLNLQMIKLTHITLWLIIFKFLFSLIFCTIICFLTFLINKT